MAEGMFSVSASAKVILFGEHSAFYGSEAIACAINLRTTATLRKGEKEGEELITLLFEDRSVHVINLNNTPSSENKSVKVVQMLADRILVNKRQFNIKIEVHSEIPIGRGLGSSGAFTAAIGGLLMYHEHGSINKERLFQIGMEAEAIFHGVPTGIDHYTSIYGGWSLVRDNKMCANDCYLDFNILVVDTGIVKDTSQMIPIFRSNVQRDAIENSNLHFADLVNEVNKGVDALLKNNMEIIPTVIHSVQKHFANNFGISNKTIDTIVELFRKYDIELKISGAGGGGCLVSFPFNNQDNTNIKHLEEIKDEMKKIIPLATIKILRTCKNGIQIKSATSED